MYVIIFIYHIQFGGDHERTKESSECLKELTQKAVAMQKTVRHHSYIAHVTIRVDV